MTASQTSLVGSVKVCAGCSHLLRSRLCERSLRTALHQISSPLPHRHPSRIQSTPQVWRHTLRSLLSSRDSTRHSAPPNHPRWRTPQSQRQSQIPHPHRQSNPHRQNSPLLPAASSARAAPRAAPQTQSTPRPRPPHPSPPTSTERHLRLLRHRRAHHHRPHHPPRPRRRTSPTELPAPVPVL